MAVREEIPDSEDELLSSSPSDAPRTSKPFDASRDVARVEEDAETSPQYDKGTKTIQSVASGNTELPQNIHQTDPQPNPPPQQESTVSSRPHTDELAASFPSQLTVDEVSGKGLGFNNELPMQRTEHASGGSVSIEQEQVSTPTTTLDESSQPIGVQEFMTVDHKTPLEPQPLVEKRKDFSDREETGLPPSDNSVVIEGQSEERLGSEAGIPPQIPPATSLPDSKATLPVATFEDEVASILSPQTGNGKSYASSNDSNAPLTQYSPIHTIETTCAGPITVAPSHATDESTHETFPEQLHAELQDEISMSGPVGKDSQAADDIHLSLRAPTLPDENSSMEIDSAPSTFLKSKLSQNERNAGPISTTMPVDTGMEVTASTSLTAVELEKPSIVSSTTDSRDVDMVESSDVASGTKEARHPDTGPANTAGANISTTPDGENSSRELRKESITLSKPTSPPGLPYETGQPAVAKTPQEISLAEMKAQRAALIASLAALENVQELVAEDENSDLMCQLSVTEPTDSDIMAAANKIVKKHIKLLHEYNEIKDVGQGLMGLIADSRGVRIVEVQDEFGVNSND
ncbi:Swi5-domain-containing protein [Byssothecium circinans]|uniref:Swi5-domain-containing protein n=1 Tax=Byssothecium circinans TaxID=147558 RepID=A0A6A5TWI0_9PLEO|nr:Swi5-domain-containing protein [Byssothecium circinans]